MLTRRDILKEMTAHIRDRIKAAGIKAKVRKLDETPTMGGVIQINVPTYEAEFSEHEQRSIRGLAATNGLTMVRGQPIDVERMTDPKTMSFYLPQAVYQGFAERYAKFPLPHLHRDRQPQARIL